MGYKSGGWDRYCEGLAGRRVAHVIPALPMSSPRFPRHPRASGDLIADPMLCTVTRGGRLRGDGVSFETHASRAPQDERNG